jgi:TPR repeat protein
MAMNCFADNDLQGYRRWLRRAAQLGDADAAFELGKFATRLPIARLRVIGRIRPQIRRKSADGRSYEMW